MGCPGELAAVNREDLIRAMGESEAQDLAILVAAREEAKRRALEDPSKTNLDALDKAEGMIKRALARQQKGTGQVFRTQVAAAAFLEERGFSVKKSKFNNDVRAGHVPTNQDGHFEESALFAYANAHLQAKAKTENLGLAAAKASEASASEVVKLKQAEWITLKLARERGEVMPVADFHAEMAARAQFFAGELRQIAPRVVPVLVALVGGDESKIGEAVRLMEEEIITAMDAWSADRPFVVELPDA